MKIIDDLGSKLSDETERSLEESMISSPLEQKDGAEVEKSSEGERIYLNNLIEIAKGIKPDQFQISIDCANGAVTNPAKKLFKELSIEYEIFNTDYDGFAINKDCGATNPASLINSMTIGNMGLTFDGDADRLIMIDEEGFIANGDVMLALLAKYFKQQDMLDGNTVVTTVMANVGLKKSLEEMDITSITTPVGDKYVAEAMSKHSASLGGEQSGHIIFSRFLPVGDGLLTAIFVLKALTFFNKKLSTIRKELITEYPQKLINFTLLQNLDPNSFDKLEEEIKKIEKRHLSEGRIFVRASGTEPLLRVLVESDSVENIENILVLIEETIAKYLNI